ncbi:MAG TPA: hypothetical protein EYP59_05450 [Thiotrichaceae bacterium]|nr:hypothetical protein [Thiotrichaceae bacterium]
MKKKERYWDEAALWHRSYFAGSVGSAPLEIVKQLEKKPLQYIQA